MNGQQFGDLLIEAYAGLSSVGWHWFAYHFHNGPTPFARSIMEACADIDDHAPGIGTKLLRELASLGGRDRDESQYEQLLQKLSEILVIRQIVSCTWPTGRTFLHEPAATSGGPRPELVVTWPGGRVAIEVKTPAILEHTRRRGANGTQLPYRHGLPLEPTKKMAQGMVTLPRDNPVLDFLKDAERKFAGFRSDPDTASLLVIVWDDFVYEPISTLVNPRSGLLTPESFARKSDGAAQDFPNIDSIIVLRHLNYFILGSRGEPLGDRSSSLDFGAGGALPNVSFVASGGRAIPQSVFEALRAKPHDDPELQRFAEYRPQDIVFWL
ncbi:MAG: hypothetical protein K2X57_00590 [Xanthobacteraceae bacterium]|nr:hypothetical protein [Xanthobacteraceae bacterium]